MSTTTNHTRESWLQAVADELWPMVIAAGGERPKSVRYSCGWPSTSALMRSNTKTRRIGECWSGGSEDETREIFISPALANPVEVADVLLHEMIHAALDPTVGHRAPFPQIAKKLGLQGKPTSTYAGEDLAEHLSAICTAVGTYPHAKLDASPRQKQGTRMMKVECPDCGYTLRTTRVWLELGTPTCPCGSQMVAVDYTAPGAESLTLAASHIEYRTTDARFILRTSREQKREGTWYVTDTQAIVLGVQEFKDPTTGETVEITKYDERIAARRNRADALAFIEAIRSGDLTWDAVEADEDEAITEDEDDDGEDWWDEDGNPIITDEEVERLAFLDDDEDEGEDFADLDLSYEERDESGEVIFPAVDDEEYEEQTARREEAGRRKSEQIARGEEGALD